MRSLNVFRISSTNMSLESDPWEGRGSDTPWTSYLIFTYNILKIKKSYVTLLGKREYAVLKEIKETGESLCQEEK